MTDLRPALEAVLMIADQPLDHVTLAQAVDHPPAEVEAALASRALEAAEVQPQRIRLLSSEEDPFLEATRALSRALGERHVTHRLTVVPGPHDYGFNRGPAGIEMLYFHDRALAREPLPE